MVNGGYTQVKNYLLARLYRDETLTGRELRVLLYLIRKLPGFHKKSDKIPYSQIADATGIERRNVIRVIKSLEEKHWISVSRKAKCINIISITASVTDDTTASVTDDTMLVSQVTPSIKNQKSDFDGSALDDPTIKVKKIINELESELDDEYE